MKRYCLGLGLQNDEELIAEYEEMHKNVWPEIKASILGSGIIDMQIYRVDTLLVMIMDTDEEFSFAHKAEMDAANPKVQEWEQLMWKYQQALPSAKPGEKWVLMDQIFALKKTAH